MCVTGPLRCKIDLGMRREGDRLGSGSVHTAIF